MADSLQQSDFNTDADGPLVSATDSAGAERLTDIWQGHELTPVHTGAEPIRSSSPGWLFLLLLFVLCVFTYLQTFYRKNFLQIITACFNNNLTNQIVRDENMLVQRASIMLNVTFSIILASLLYLISVHYDWYLAGIGTGFLRFIFLALIVSAAFTVKFLVLRFCGYLFNLEREMATYIFNIFILNNLLAIALLPFIALILFSNVLSAGLLFAMAISLAGLVYIYRIGRGVLIALGASHFSPFYLFLYLCALEIAPLLVLIKLVLKQ